MTTALELEHGVKWGVEVSREQLGSVISEVNEEQKAGIYLQDIDGLPATCLAEIHFLHI